MCNVCVCKVLHKLIMKILKCKKKLFTLEFKS